MTTTLTHIQVGDLIAETNKERNWGDAPPITQHLYRVTKRTPTQAEAVNVHHKHLTIRVRVSDGKIIGTDYSTAVFATPEIIAQHNAQVAALNRWREARSRLQDLEGRYLHQLRLTVEQMEVLAEAWERVKSMDQESTTTRGAA